MKRRLPFVFLLLGAVAAGTAFWVWRQRAARADGELVLYGNVDIREVNLGFRVSGRIVEMLRDEGDAVAAGEVLARLDAEPLRRELDQAEAQAASLAAKVEMLENGYRREEVAQARAALAEREATMVNAERLFERQEKLLRTAVTTQQDFDDAKARRNEARARTDTARASLALQEAGYRPEEIAQAKADLAKARAAAAADAIQVRDPELRSPSAGVVLTRAVETGAILQAGATAFTVSLEDPVWARVYVDEPHLGRVPPGAEVLVYTDSRRDRPYHGRVGYVSPRAEFTPKSVETTELRTALVYRLRVVVTDAGSGLRQGMPVTVRLAAGQPDRPRP